MNRKYTIFIFLSHYKKTTFLQYDLKFNRKLSNFLTLLLQKSRFHKKDIKND